MLREGTTNPKNSDMTSWYRRGVCGDQARDEESSGSRVMGKWVATKSEARRIDDVPLRRKKKKTRVEKSSFGV